jgi:hypothetical protein
MLYITLRYQKSLKVKIMQMVYAKSEPGNI